jgi:hypothetical protein
MAYSQGGLIEATDYNDLINGTNKFNTVWGLGTGTVGYNQTALSTVSASSVVSATQWATLINNMNNARRHQTGATTGLTAPTTGNRIDFLSTMNTQLTNLYNSSLTYNASGTTTVGSNITAGISVAADVEYPLTSLLSRTVTFSSTDHARAFFNAGGRLKYVISAVDNAGNDRSIAVRDTINQLGGVNDFAANDNGGRSGTGGNLVTNELAYGYYTQTTTEIVGFRISEDAPYNGAWARIALAGPNGTTTRGSTGTQVRFRLQVFIPADDALGGAVNVTTTGRVDIIYPSTTYLSATGWGTPTIT